MPSFHKKCSLTLECATFIFGRYNIFRWEAYDAPRKVIPLSVSQPTRRLCCAINPQQVETSGKAACQ